MIPSCDQPCGRNYDPGHDGDVGDGEPSCAAVAFVEICLIGRRDRSYERALRLIGPAFRADHLVVVESCVAVSAGAHREKSLVVADVRAEMVIFVQSVRHTCG